MRPEIKKTNTKLCLADGGVINTMGYIDLPIQVENFTTVQKFTVADIDVPAVIGYDFLRTKAFIILLESPSILPIVMTSVLGGIVTFSVSDILNKELI
jgi:hypothetical protein